MSFIPISNYQCQLGFAAMADHFEENGDIEQANMIRSLIEAGYCSLTDLSLSVESDHMEFEKDYLDISFDGSTGAGRKDHFGFYYDGYGKGRNDEFEYIRVGVGNGSADDPEIMNTTRRDNLPRDYNYQNILNGEIPLNISFNELERGLQTLHGSSNVLRLPLHVNYGGPIGRGR